VAEGNLQWLQLDADAPGFDAALAKLTALEASQDATLDGVVAGILADVRARGDAAVLEYTRRFDRLDVASMQALEIPARGLTCTTAVHICYGYGIKANNDWKETLGGEWRQYAQVFPALAASSIQQVSLECYHSHVPPDLMALLKDKDVMVGVIDVASSEIETPEQIADTIGEALKYVPRNRIFPCTNCGLAPMSREVATKKLEALAKGAALARQRYGA
jgi:methionine synthase II (cobalamin-independent)